MTFITLTETAQVPLRKVGTKWRVTLARPGKGTSGDYSEDVLKEFGPVAFPKGTRSFFNHDTKRDLRDLVGTYDAAFWNEEDGELQADLVALPKWNDLLAELQTLGEQVGEPVAAASIRAQGRKDAAGNVVELMYNRGNTVDLVGLPGLEGSGVKFQIESLREEMLNADAEASAQIERKTRMEEKIKELAEKFDKFMTVFEAFVSESRSEVQGKADEAAVDTAVNAKLAERHESFLAVKEQIAEAKLTPTQTKNLEARALKGEDIAEALTEAKALVEEVRGTFTEGGEYVVVGEDRKQDNDKFTVTGWGK